MKFPIKEMTCQGIVLPMKFPIKEMTCQEIVLPRKCPIKDMYYQGNVSLHKIKISLTIFCPTLF